VRTKRQICSPTRLRRFVWLSVYSVCADWAAEVIRGGEVRRRACDLRLGIAELGRTNLGPDACHQRRKGVRQTAAQGCCRTRRSPSSKGWRDLACSIRETLPETAEEAPSSSSDLPVAAECSSLVGTRPCALRLLLFCAPATPARASRSRIFFHSSRPHPHRLLLPVS
jgi:hypothetical protein